MYYKVNDLRNKLDEKILGLGIDTKFKETPAYESVLIEIDNLISQMNMFELSDKVTVYEEKGSISFNWDSPDGKKYSFNISCSNPETVRCIRTEEKNSVVSTNGQVTREKNVIEKVASIDETSGYVTLITNGSMIDNINCGIGKCNNSTWSEKKYYDSNGVMINREYKGFSKGALTENFDNTRIDSMLYIPRGAFKSGFLSDNYEIRALLVRDKLDTARIVLEDKKKQIKYSTIMPLNQEYGLRDMNFNKGYDTYPQDIVISPLSKEEIEIMIQRETNPKVAEGLRSYAVGRENYYYNSQQDKYFISEGTLKPHKISR